MASTNAPLYSGDELDDILSGIAAEGGYVQSPAEPTTSTANTTSKNADAGLGIDEEIVVTKKRIPIPKLDDVRLRSEAGIPRLRRISKDRLRFKGKGHEYGDIARMLNMYQLWLDDLYPRAKFADALAIIEKVGHTKRMQVDRKAWIDDGKPKHSTEHDDSDLDATIPNELPEPDKGNNVGGQETETVPTTTQSATEVPTDSGAQSHPLVEEPDEDELDALLADGAQPDDSAPTTLSVRSNTVDDDPFADEMEAMEGMEDMW